MRDDPMAENKLAGCSDLVAAMIRRR